LLGKTKHAREADKGQKRPTKAKKTDKDLEAKRADKGQKAIKSQITKVQQKPKRPVTK
jgi:hypothetical protein